MGVSRPRNGLENGAPENLAYYANLFPKFIGIGWYSSLSFPGLSSRSTSLFWRGKTWNQPNSPNIAMGLPAKLGASVQSNRRGVAGLADESGHSIFFFNSNIWPLFFFENSDRYIFSKKKLDKSCPIFNSLHAGIICFA